MTVSWNSHKTRTLLAIGADDALHMLLADYPVMLLVKDGHEMLSRITPGQQHVLLFGANVEPSDTIALLGRITFEFPTAAISAIVVNGSASLVTFQAFVDTGTIFYLAHGHLQAPEMLALVRAASADVEALSARARRLACIAGSESLLAFHNQMHVQKDLVSAAALLEEVTASRLVADCARYLAYDAESDTLRPVCSPRLVDEHYTVASGLSGYVIRAMTAVRSDRADLDSRFDAVVDDPGGFSQHRLLAYPLGGLKGDPPLGVMAVLRSPAAEPFSEDDVTLCGQLAATAAPTLNLLSFQADVTRSVRETARRTGELFRNEAIDYYAGASQVEGRLPTVAPTWLRHAHWWMLALAVFGVLYLGVAQVNESAEGPAFIQAAIKFNVVAVADQMVRSVDVSVGDQLRAGDRLFSLYPRAQGTLLGAPMLDVSAPAEGVVTQVLVRVGQVVHVGDPMASIVDERQGYEVVALLPGFYAPLLRPDQRIALRVDGYPNSHAEARIERVSREVASAQDAAQHVGGQVSGAATGGPVVVVRAKLSRAGFEADGQRFAFRDGMKGVGRVVVRSESMLLAAIPGLERVWRR